MNSSPLTSWENVSAYFTFADNPIIISVLCLSAVAVFSGFMLTLIKHENESFDKHRD